MVTTERLSFTAPRGTLDELREYAASRDLSVSQVVRLGLREIGIDVERDILDGLVPDRNGNGSPYGNERPRAPRPQPRQNA